MAKKAAAPKKFTARTDKVGRFYVETWYDRRSKNWITMIKTEKGLGGLDVRDGSDYAGHESTARFNHEAALVEASRMK